MAAFVDAWWRAAVYCFHPRVVLLTLPPLLLALAMIFGLGWLYWEPSVAEVRSAIDRWELLTTVFEWLDSIGAPSFRSMLAPLVLVALAVPAIVVASLLLVGWLAAPPIAAFVAQRRFAALQRSPQAPGVWLSLAWSVLCTMAALLALAFSMPLWLVPPLVLVLPPWIWGWLSYRVLAFAVLARHADGDERRALLHRLRWPLRTIGLACGVAGVLPSLLWATSAATLVLAPMLVLLAVWLYTLVFTFASLWFAHYLLAELFKQRNLKVRVST